MPNLENLRKQAKLYLRWHRDGYHPVAVEIRLFLAGYGHLTDRQILDRPFKLADAQDLVARKSGFESWQALRQGIATMTTSLPQAPAKTGPMAAEPLLFVTDIAASCAFFTGKLGFQTAFTYGAPPFYAQVFRDGARLNLRCVEGPVFDAGFRARETDALSAIITLADSKALFLELQAAGVVFHQTLRTEPWGARTFIVQDPDGNLIAFAGGQT